MGVVNVWRVIRRSFLISLIVVLNITIIGLLTAYFRGQQLDLFDTIGIFADCVGVTTGLLGIWFFMFSESLNRSTAANLQRTTEVVDDLRNQMWHMIQQTFTLFVRSEDKEAAQEAEKALKKLKDPASASAEELGQATQAIIRRLETLERQREFSSVSFHSGGIFGDELEMFARGERIRHVTFGRGIVVSSYFDRGNQEVTISFLYHGIRMVRADPDAIKRISPQEFANGVVQAADGLPYPA